MKILWPETAVWVQVPLAVPRVNVKRDECPQIYLKGRSFLFAFLLQVLQWDLRRKSLLSSSLPECCGGTYVESPPRGTKKQKEQARSVGLPVLL